MITDINARDYLFTPEPLTAEQRRHLQAWGIDYSAPGQIPGIRQYEAFCGLVRSVNVHPNFPADITHSNALGYHTSDRRAAVRFAMTAPRPSWRLTASVRLTPPRHAYKAHVALRMLHAAASVRAFLALYAPKGRLDRSLPGFDAAAASMLAPCSWRMEQGSRGCAAVAWPNVPAMASNVAHRPTADYTEVDTVRRLVGEIGWWLRTYAREGWISMPVAMQASLDLEAAIA